MRLCNRNRFTFNSRFKFRCFVLFQAESSCQIFRWLNWLYSLSKKISEIVWLSCSLADKSETPPRPEVDMESKLELREHSKNFLLRHRFFVGILSDSEWPSESSLKNVNKNMNRVKKRSNYFISRSPTFYTSSLLQTFFFSSKFLGLINIIVNGERTTAVAASFLVLCYFIFRLCCV